MEVTYKYTYIYDKSILTLDLDDRVANYSIDESGPCAIGKN